MKELHKTLLFIFTLLWGCFNSIRGCGVIKKRNKKYNPNKPALNPVRKFQLIGAFD